MVHHISFWIRPFQLYQIVDRTMPTVSGTTVEGIADLMVDVNTKHHQRITGDSLETWSFLPWIFCRLCGSTKGRFNMRSTRESDRLCLTRFRWDREHVMICTIISLVFDLCGRKVTSGVNRGRWLVQRYSFKNAPDLPSREIVPYGNSPHSYDHWIRVVVLSEMTSMTSVDYSGLAEQRLNFWRYLGISAFQLGIKRTGKLTLMILKNEEIFCTRS